jgi:hypothetical protein
MHTATVGAGAGCDLLLFRNGSRSKDRSLRQLLQKHPTPCGRWRGLRAFAVSELVEIKRSQPVGAAAGCDLLAVSEFQKDRSLRQLLQKYPTPCGRWRGLRSFAVSELLEIKRSQLLQIGDQGIGTTV